MKNSLKIAFIVGLVAMSVAVPLEPVPAKTNETHTSSKNGASFTATATTAQREGRQYGYGGNYFGGPGGLGYSGSNAFASANAGSTGFGGLGFSGANAAASANSFGGGFGR